MVENELQIRITLNKIKALNQKVDFLSREMPRNGVDRILIESEKQFLLRTILLYEKRFFKLTSAQKHSAQKH
jgi:CRISPR/Cas system-associated protein endoribonuclease Cas2